MSHTPMNDKIYDKSDKSVFGRSRHYRMSAYQTVVQELRCIFSVTYLGVEYKRKY